MAIHFGHQGHEVLKALSPAEGLANDDPAWLLVFFFMAWKAVWSLVISTASMLASLFPHGSGSDVDINAGDGVQSLI